MVIKAATVDKAGEGLGVRGQGGVRNRVTLNDRQWLVNAYEAGTTTWIWLARRIGVNYNTTRNTIRL